ncbi:hypothetical protein GGI42DRAFT_333660, partial [Trichoderma sp. SZMC 28013]
MSVDYSTLPKSKDSRMESFGKELNEKLKSLKGHRHNLNNLADTLYTEINGRFFVNPDQAQRESL